MGSFTLKMYNFTTFAMQLNELDKEIEDVIPKTDSRLRPDIRAMENGDIGKCLSAFVCGCLFVEANKFIFL